MHSNRRSQFLSVAFRALHSALCISAFAGCGRAAPGDRLVVLSPNRDEIREEVARGFAAWHAAQHPTAPPVAVVWQDVGGTSQIAKFVESQFGVSPDGIGVDVLFGGGTDIYVRFARQGLLAPLALSPQLLARIPAQLNGIPLYDPQGRWFGPVLSSFGILSNRRVLDRIGQPLPRHWEDLGAPGLSTWVGAGDPRMTGSVHMVYEIVLQDRGWDAGMRLLLRLAANARGFIRDSGTLTRQVSEGEVAAAGNLDANALSAVGRDPDGMAYVLPAGATILNPDAAAVLAGAPRPELARAFIEFLLSDHGQKLFLLKPGLPGGPLKYPLCRLSVVPDLYRQYPPPERSVGDADPFTLGNTFAYRAAVGQQRWDALNDLLGAVAVDPHADLATAWQRLLAASFSDESRQSLEDQLFQPPCSEDDLRNYAARIAVESPRYRAETINRWGEEARRRYRAVAREARAR